MYLSDAPAPASTGVPVTMSNEPSVTTPSTPPRPPIPPTPPISLLSRDLHDFKSLSSPPPLSSNLEPTFCPDEDPLDRLPPEKKAKLDEQGAKCLCVCLYICLSICVCVHVSVCSGGHILNTYIVFFYS